jgi:hypothetical protein
MFSTCPGGDPSYRSRDFYSHGKRAASLLREVRPRPRLCPAAMRVYFNLFWRTSGSGRHLMTKLCGFPEYFPVRAISFPVRRKKFPFPSATGNGPQLIDIGHQISSPSAAKGRAEENSRLFSRPTGNAAQRTGAHSTSSMSSAAVASMTRRSKPSAMPAQGGSPPSRAARKSSSIG